MEQNNMGPHAHYLIDLENTGCRWANIIPELKPQDTITVFFSDATGRLDNNALCAAYKKGAAFRFLSCANGKANAMDFQIMAELGRLSVQAPEDIYYMVTNDHGFESVIGYMANLDIAVSRLDACGISASACSDACAHTDQRPAPDKAQTGSYEGIPDEPGQEPATRHAYIKMLKEHGVTGTDSLRIAAGILYAAMKEPPNRRKLSTMNRFQSRYGIKDGTERYKQIRGLVFAIAENGPFPPAEYVSAGTENMMLKAAKAAATQPARKKWRAIDCMGVNNIVTQSGDGNKILKGTTQKVVECIEDARKAPDPKETLKKLMLDYMTPAQVNKALPKLALRYL